MEFTIYERGQFVVSAYVIEHCVTSIRREIPSTLIGYWALIAVKSHLAHIADTFCGTVEVLPPNEYIGGRKNLGTVM